PQLAGLKNPRRIALQFRYGFVIDDEGLKVIDVTDITRPRLVTNARVPIADPRDIYVSRTYAYVAAGHEGLVIVDVERPRAPVKAHSTHRGRARRPPRRQSGHDHLMPLRLRRRRASRAQGLPTHQRRRSRRYTDLHGFQPPPAPPTHRRLQDRRPRHRR